MFVFGGNFELCCVVLEDTPKPGRSPTRQYSVLSCFFPSRPASDFFLDFKKHLLLAVPANQVHQAEKHLKG